MKIGRGPRVVGVFAAGAVLGSILTFAPLSATTGGDPANPTCNGLEATIVGTSGDDVLQGTFMADVIVGLGGDDIINGASGEDTICGGDGDDTINGQSQSDTIFGEAGNDTITGADGEDVIDGGPGNDNIRGDSQDDTLIGGDGDDTVTGSSGADIIDGGDGADTITGDSQNDVIQGGNGDDDINGGSGNDTLDGGNGVDVVDGSFNNDTCDDAETAISCETETQNGEDDPEPATDTDGDGIPDSEDPDIDNDGTPNEDDAFPLDANEDTDTDGDGVGDNTDEDVDGDGTPNINDAFPLDPNEDTDTDGDGIGNNADEDDDNDGILDEDDSTPTVPGGISVEALSTFDGVGGSFEILTTVAEPAQTVVARDGAGNYYPLTERDDGTWAISINETSLFPGEEYDFQVEVLSLDNETQEPVVVSVDVPERSAPTVVDNFRPGGAVEANQLLVAAMATGVHVNSLVLTHEFNNGEVPSGFTGTDVAQFPDGGSEWSFVVDGGNLPALSILEFVLEMTERGELPARAVVEEARIQAPSDQTMAEFTQLVASVEGTLTQQSTTQGLASDAGAPRSFGLVPGENPDDAQPFWPRNVDVFWEDEPTLTLCERRFFEAVSDDDGNVEVSIESSLVRHSDRYNWTSGGCEVGNDLELELRSVTARIHGLNDHFRPFFESHTDDAYELSLQQFSELVDIDSFDEEVEWVLNFSSPPNSVLVGEVCADELADRFPINRIATEQLSGFKLVDQRFATADGSSVSLFISNLSGDVGPYPDTYVGDDCHQQGVGFGITEPHLIPDSVDSALFRIVAKAGSVDNGALSIVHQKVDDMPEFGDSIRESVEGAACLLFELDHDSFCPGVSDLEKNASFIIAPPSISGQSTIEREQNFAPIRFEFGSGGSGFCAIAQPSGTAITRTVHPVLPQAPAAELPFTAETSLVSGFTCDRSGDPVARLGGPLGPSDISLAPYIAGDEYSQPITVTGPGGAIEELVIIGEPSLLDPLTEDGVTPPLRRIIFDSHDRDNKYTLGQLPGLAVEGDTIVSTDPSEIADTRGYAQYITVLAEGDGWQALQDFRLGPDEIIEQETPDGLSVTANASPAAVELLEEVQIAVVVSNTGSESINAVTGVWFPDALTVTDFPDSCDRLNPLVFECSQDGDLDAGSDIEFTFTTNVNPTFTNEVVLYGAGLDEPRFDQRLNLTRAPTGQPFSFCTGCLAPSTSTGTPGFAGSWAHPNLITFDGARYVFHGAGDYVLAESTTDNFQVVARFGRMGSSQVSLNRALAATVGDSVIAFGDDPDLVVFEQQPVHLDGVELVVDGDPTPLPGGAEIALINNRYRVTWPDGTTLEAGRRVGDAWTFGLGEARWGNVIGMLGNANGNNQDDLFARNGEPFAYTDDTLYSVFGASWLLDENSTPFLTALGSDQGLPIIPGAPITLADLTPEEIAFGEAACRLAGVREGAGLAECIFDVGLTGDVRWIEGYADVDALILRSISVQASMLLLEDDTAVTVPGTLAGSIDGTSATDIYRFDLVEGSTVFIDGGIDCPSDFGFEFSLEAPSGFFVGTSRGNSCGELGLYDLPETGEYSLRVYDAAGFTGDYNLEVALPAIVEGRIELDEIVADNIEAFGETSHVFSLTETTSVYLDWIGCHTLFDPVWELSGPDGVVTESGTCGNFANRTFEDLTPGDWTLRVFSEGTSGDYSFQLYEVLDDEFFDIDVDVPVSGEMTSPRQTHTFTFDVSEPDGVHYLDVSQCSIFNHEITVTSPDGTVAVEGARCSSFDLLLDSAGVWTLEIFSVNEVFRPYQFEIIDVADPQTRAINVDEPVTGTFPTARSIIEHTFTVPAGHDGRYFFDFDGCASLGVDRTITSPDGTILGGALGRCTSGEITLDQSGEWTILLQTDQVARDYGFTIVDIADPQTRSINVDESVTGSLTTAFATVTHTFTVPEGHDGRYYLDFDGCSRFGINRTVTAPDGTILGSALFDCTSGFAQLDQPGEWTILLQTDNTPRDYEFTIRDIADTTTTAIALGEIAAGTFATPDEVDEYTFNIPDTGSYDIDIISCTGFGVRAAYTLTAPDGTVVFPPSRCVDQTFTGQVGEWTFRITSINEISAYELQVIATP